MDAAGVVEPGPVTIYRLDAGGSRDRGHYKCSECAWEGTDKPFTSPQSHIRTAHPGRRLHTERKVPRALSQDPAAVYKRKWYREDRERKKVCRARAGLCSAPPPA